MIEIFPDVGSDETPLPAGIRPIQLISTGHILVTCDSPRFFRLHVSASAARELAQAIPIDGCCLCGRKDALAEIGNS